MQILKNSGVSLLELLLATVLLAILLTLATPVYKTFIASDRAAAEVVQLTAGINFARSEAVKRHSIVTLCKSADGKKCGGDWSQGWVVFVDRAGDAKLNSDDQLLIIHQILKGKAQLRLNASHSDDYLQFDPSGNTHGQDGSFIYCSGDKNPQSVYAIVVSQTGRARISKGKDANGQNIICSYDLSE